MRWRLRSLAGWVAAVCLLGALGSPVEGVQSWGKLQIDTLGVWRAWDSQALPVESLARRWAPILWFSDNEPAFAESEYLPSAIPVDVVPQTQDRGIVYYRATVAADRDQSSWSLAALGVETKDAPATHFIPCISAPDACLNLNRVGLIRLQYLFYFEEDYGAGSHEHDLEIAEFWFEVADGVNNVFRVALTEVVGYAHGHLGLANKLALGADADSVELPITLLIERGKHAPAPDRNGDGEFSPGFDVNRMVADAWGIRDVFGSGWYGNRTYSSWMTLPRTDRRRAVEENLEVELDSSEWHYELRDFRSASQKANPAPDLKIYLDHHDYQARPQNGGRHLFSFFQNFGIGGRIDLGLGPYLSWMSPEVPYIGGHMVATGTVGISFTGNNIWGGLSALYSPAIAAFVNAYGGLTWMACSGCPSGTGFGPEAGLKFRIPIPHPPAPDFVGLRVGLRAASFSSVGPLRLLVEFGLATP